MEWVDEKSRGGQMFQHSEDAQEEQAVTKVLKPMFTPYPSHPR